MKTCAEVQRVLGRYLAMELPEVEEGWVRTHLGECPACRGLVEEREPSLILAGALARQRVREQDNGFLPEVLAAVHQRRLEARLQSRRRRWLAAAAAVVGVLLAGLGALRQAPVEGPVVARHVVPQSFLLPPAVEVEGEDVRLYQLVGGTSGEVQVAFIIDPGLEL